MPVDKKLLALGYLPEVRFSDLKIGKTYHLMLDDVMHPKDSEHNENQREYWVFYGYSFTDENEPPMIAKEPIQLHFAAKSFLYAWQRAAKHDGQRIITSLDPTKIYQAEIKITRVKPKTIKITQVIINEA